MAKKQRIRACECGKLFVPKQSPLCPDCVKKKVINILREKLYEYIIQKNKRRIKRLNKKDDPIWYVWQRICARSRKEHFYVERSWRHSYEQFKRYILRLGYVHGKCQIRRINTNLGYRYGNLKINPSKGYSNPYLEIEKKNLLKEIPRQGKIKYAYNRTYKATYLRGNSHRRSSKRNNHEINS